MQPEISFLVEQSEAEDVETLFRQIVELNVSRICTRLRLKRRQKKSKSPVELLHEVVHDNTLRELECAKLTEIREQAALLLNLNQDLEKKPLSHRDVSSY